MDLEEKETMINNEFDYSNIIVAEEPITYLVQFCSQVYNNFLKLLNEEQQKNEKLKYEFQNYNYKKHFANTLEIRTMDKNYNSISYSNYDTFIEGVKNKQLRNINSLEINLNLSYKRGKNENLIDHENSFKIVFKPYEIKFSRVSNHKEENMDQIENTINQILNKFQAVNTIFCNKLENEARG